MTFCLNPPWACFKCNELGREGCAEQCNYLSGDSYVQDISHITAACSFGEPSHTACTLWFLLGKLMGIIELHVLVTKMINKDLKVHMHILPC